MKEIWGKNSSVLQSNWGEEVRKWSSFKAVIDLSFGPKFLTPKTPPQGWKKKNEKIVGKNSSVLQSNWGEEVRKWSSFKADIDLSFGTHL